MHGTLLYDFCRGERGERSRGFAGPSLITGHRRSNTNLFYTSPVKQGRPGRGEPQAGRRQEEIMNS